MEGCTFKPEINNYQRSNYFNLVTERHYEKPSEKDSKKMFKMRQPKDIVTTED